MQVTAGRYDAGIFIPSWQRLHPVVTLEVPIWQVHHILIIYENVDTTSVGYDIISNL